MFDHVMIRVGDRAASERVYALLLDTLGIARGEWGPFTLDQADDEHPPTTGLHIGFAAPSHAHIERFWRAGLDAGLEDDGAPGPRPEYGADYHGAFLRDPDGNSIEAARHDETPGRDVIDHLWIRVADLAASRAFYAHLAPHAGLRLRDVAGRVHVGGEGGSFALLEGAPTANLHLAFAADRDAFLADPDGNTVELVGG